MPDTYRASTLKNEAAALMRNSLPFKLLDAKAALTAFSPENSYSRHIPKPYAAMGISNLMHGLGWMGGLAALSGLGYMGYRWNKKIAESAKEQAKFMHKIRQQYRKEFESIYDTFKRVSKGRDFPRRNEILGKMRKSFDFDSTKYYAPDQFLIMR